MNLSSQKVKHFFINIFIFSGQVAVSIRKTQKSGIFYLEKFFNIFFLRNKKTPLNTQKTDSFPIRIAESALVDSG